MTNSTLVCHSFPISFLSSAPRSRSLPPLFASACSDAFCTAPQGMFGRSSTVPLSSFEYPKSCSQWLVTSTPVPNSLPTCNLSCGFGPIVHIGATPSKPCNLKYTLENYRINSVPQMQTVILEDEQKKHWEGCKEILSKLNFSTEEADTILKKAFGWVRSPYWGEERVKEVPKAQMINEMLDYLKSLSLNDDDIYKLLKKFPEVLGCNLADEVKTNVGLLEEDWGIRGKQLKNLLLRNPKVLGYNVDCKGDCMAQCTRCWVRF